MSPEVTSLPTLHPTNDFSLFATPTIYVSDPKSWSLIQWISNEMLLILVVVSALVLFCLINCLILILIQKSNRSKMNELELKNIVDPQNTSEMRELQRTATHSIFLGRNIPGQGEVTQTLWDIFLKSEVLTRLEYATITEGTGIYKGDTEKVIIVSVNTNQQEIIQSLREVGDAYKSQFGQESVMYTVTPVPEVIFT